MTVTTDIQPMGVDLAKSLVSGGQGLKSHKSRNNFVLYLRQTGEHGKPEKLASGGSTEPNPRSKSKVRTEVGWDDVL